MVQKYARYLIMVRLDNIDNSKTATVDDVILSIRRLPWTETEHKLEEIVTNAFLHMARNKYVSIPNLADCLSGLVR